MAKSNEQFWVLGRKAGPNAAKHDVKCRGWGLGLVYAMNGELRKPVS